MSRHASKTNAREEGKGDGGRGRVTRPCKLTGGDDSDNEKNQVEPQQARQKHRGQGGITKSNNVVTETTTTLPTRKLSAHRNGNGDEESSSGCRRQQAQQQREAEAEAPAIMQLNLERGRGRAERTEDTEETCPKNQQGKAPQQQKEEEEEEEAQQLQIQQEKEGEKKTAPQTSDMVFLRKPQQQQRRNKDEHAGTGLTDSDSGNDSYSESEEDTTATSTSAYSSSEEGGSEHKAETVETDSNAGPERRATVTIAPLGDAATKAGMEDASHPPHKVAWAAAQKKRSRRHKQGKSTGSSRRQRSNKFDVLHAQRDKRVSYSLGMATKAAREGRLFEHFLVVGYPASALQSKDDTSLSSPSPPLSFRMSSHRQSPEEPEEEEERDGAEEDIPSPNQVRKGQEMETETEKPVVLFQYPDSKTELNQVADFCFPEGVKARCIDIRASMTKLNEVLFASLSKLEESEHSYSFVMTGQETLFYGFCVKQEELVDELPSFVKSATMEQEMLSKDLPMGGRRERSGLRYAAPRCYCLISRFPFFQLHFQVLYSLLATERFNLINSQPDDAFWESSLTTLSPTPSPRKETSKKKIREKKNRSRSPSVEGIRSSSSSSGSDPGSSTRGGTKTTPTSNNPTNIQTTASPNEAIKMLNSYHNTMVSLNKLSFQLPGELQSQIKFTCPEGSEEKLIADWCLASLMRLFSLSDLLFIFRALLVETKTIFVCKNLGVLSCIVFSFIPLLRPYVWQGPFIPILPVDLEECIQSPVPFLIGIPELSQEARQNEEIAEECLVIDIDRYSISLPKTPIPSLPREDNLISRLRPYWDTLNPGSASPVGSPNECPSPCMLRPSITSNNDNKTFASPSLGSRRFTALQRIRSLKNRVDTPKDTQPSNPFAQHRHLMSKAFRRWLEEEADTFDIDETGKVVHKKAVGVTNNLSKLGRNLFADNDKRSKTTDTIDDRTTVNELKTPRESLRQVLSNSYNERSALNSIIRRDKAVRRKADSDLQPRLEETVAVKNAYIEEGNSGDETSNNRSNKFSFEKMLTESRRKKSIGEKKSWSWGTKSTDSITKNAPVVPDNDTSTVETSAPSSSNFSPPPFSRHSSLESTALSSALVEHAATPSSPIRRKMSASKPIPPKKSGHKRNWSWGTNKIGKKTEVKKSPPSAVSAAAEAKKNLPPLHLSSVSESRRPTLSVSPLSPQVERKPTPHGKQEGLQVDKRCKHFVYPSKTTEEELKAVRLFLHHIRRYQDWLMEEIIAQVKHHNLDIYHLQFSQFAELLDSFYRDSSGLEALMTAGGDSGEGLEEREKEGLSEGLTPFPGIPLHNAATATPTSNQFNTCTNKDVHIGGHNPKRKKKEKKKQKALVFFEHEKDFLSRLFSTQQFMFFITTKFPRLLSEVQKRKREAKIEKLKEMIKEEKVNRKISKSLLNVYDVEGAITGETKEQEEITKNQLRQKIKESEANIQHMKMLRKHLKMEKKNSRKEERAAAKSKNPSSQ
ncbi:UDENN domain-containing protein [Balamuthia mandrillaris]